MNEHQNHFQNITQLFSNAQYSQGRNSINTLMATFPNNSMLYSNRALLSSQLGENALAKMDLQKAIQLSPFNYVAYFNLFSVLIKLNEKQEAYKNLCSALSCVYLLKAKQEKRIEFADKSLEYSPNNIAAQLLINSLKESTKQAETNPYNQKDTKNRLQQLLNSRNRFMLRGCSQTIDLNKQIQQKVSQFNKLYGELNKANGLITHRVNRQQFILNAQTFVRERSKASNSSKQSVIAILENQDYFNARNKVSQIQSGSETNPENIEQIIALCKYAQPSEEVNHLQIKQIPSVIQEHQIQQDQKQLRYSQTLNHFIYSSPHQKRMQMNLISFTFFDSPVPAPKNVYCTVCYNQRIIRSHLVDCRQEECFWNQNFDPIDLSSEPELMTLKVFDKQFNNIRDYLIGEVQFIVDVADLLKLPIYNQESEPIGQIMLHLQLAQAKRH